VVFARAPVNYEKRTRARIVSSDSVLARVALRHLTFVRGKCGQDFSPLPLGHVEVVKRSRKLSRHFVENVGRDLQGAMGFFQAKVCFAGLRGCVDLGAAGDVADSERAHEFQAWEPAQIVCAPFV
jgi:hypothetical protein